jgi:putative N6-adenine-specific DNA methylase
VQKFDSSSPDLRGSMPALPYFATAAKGTEGLLRDELRELGIRPLRGDRGGVHFGGDLAEAFRVCLHSRLAIRVLEFRGSAKVTDDKQLYDYISSLSFDDVLDDRLTIAVSANVRSSRLTHSQFVSRRVKDAIVDRQRARVHCRSNVDAEDPDVHFNVHLVKDQATIYVDLAGDALHRRGYRSASAQAPLKETLACALIRLSQWDLKLPFSDPCCGSGTIALEAALMAANWAPGLLRNRFGLERHLRVDTIMRNKFEEQRSLAQAAIDKERASVVWGSDIDWESITMAKKTAERLQLPLRVSRHDLLNLKPPQGEGILVTNPPYGIRMEGGHELVQRLGHSLSQFKGYRIIVLTPDRSWLSAMSCRPTLEHTLYNGDIECRALGWQL